MKFSLFAVFILFSVGINCIAQEVPDTSQIPVVIEAEIPEPILDLPDAEPMFPGGEVKMNEFIRQHVVYPELSKENGEQGTVYVQFIINKDGTISDISILRGVSELLDAEAMRIIMLMPKWTPAQSSGKVVRTYYTVPINFKIF